MISKKKATKVIIIFILFVFLVITWLSAIVPYLGKTTPNGTWDIDTWTLVESGISTDVLVESETVDSGTIELPKVSKEEASKKLQETLSGLNVSK